MYFRVLKVNEVVKSMRGELVRLEQNKRVHLIPVTGLTKGTATSDGRLMTG